MRESANKKAAHTQLSHGRVKAAKDKLNMIFPQSQAPVNATPFLYAVAANTQATPKNRFAPTPNLFVDAILPNLTGNAVKVYIYLQRHADRQSARVVRSVDEIAAACGIGRATAWRALQQLSESGVIAAEARWGWDGGQQRAARVRNAYTLTSPDRWQMSDKVEITRENNNHVPAQKVQKTKKNDHASTNAFQTSHNSNNKQRAVVFSHENVSTAPENAAQPTPASTCAPNVPEADALPENPLLAQMTAIGIKEPVARQLLKSHSAEAIAQQLNYLPQRDAKNPAAMLVQSIKGAWDAPATAAVPAEAPRAPKPTLTPERKAHIDKCRAQAAKLLLPTLSDSLQRQAAQCTQGGETLVQWMERMCNGEMVKLVRQLLKPC